MTDHGGGREQRLDRSRRPGPSRRALLARAGTLAFTSLLAPWAAASPARAQGAPRFLDYPFTLGVASGDPLSDGFVIWTRLAPDPFAPMGGMGDAPVEVSWAVAEDEGMTKPVRAGQTVAWPELGHSVHVELRGLSPDRPYFYRFEAGNEASPTGRARTAPVYGAPHRRLKLAFCSCQRYEAGFFSAYRDMVEGDPDLILHLGDYIYESPSSLQIRRHEGPEPETLAEYRARYALYKLDADLQLAHAHTSWAMTWDDHEVDNDYANDRSENFDDAEAFLARRAAAYQAYYEHMPLRRLSMPRGPSMQMFSRLTFGDLIEFNILDTRQYRHDQACARDGDGGGLPLVGCAEVFDPARSMLGAAQERWLLNGLGRGPAGWNVIAQQMLFSKLDAIPGPDRMYFSDMWDGYVANRQRILAHIAEAGVGNPVILGGDIHSFFACDVHRDFEHDDAPVVAAEFVGGSITSRSARHDTYEAALSENPHIRFVDARVQGYARAEVTPDRWLTEFRAVENTADPKSGVRRLAAFVVEAGEPGVKPA